MIRVQDINKSFDGKTVLKDINISFGKGQCNMLIGASGSGKTVLMNLIAGLLSPDSGEIWYEDEPLSSMGEQERKQLHQRIGILFQGSALFDFRTVLGNVMFPLDFLTDWPDSKKIAHARELLDRVNVKDAEDKYPEEISGGMQKRVGIARALALNPSFLFCDEPNSGLDPETSIIIDHLIRDLTKEFNITTIINTHDMNSIMEIGDTIGFLYKGEIVWKGDKNDIMSTDCPQLKDFLCSNALARNILKSTH